MVVRRDIFEYRVAWCLEYSPTQHTTVKEKEQQKKKRLKSNKLLNLKWFWCFYLVLNRFKSVKRDFQKRKINWPLLATMYLRLVFVYFFVSNRDINMCTYLLRALFFMMCLIGCINAACRFWFVFFCLKQIVKNAINQIFINQFDAHIDLTSVARVHFNCVMDRGETILNKNHLPDMVRNVIWELYV